ncbi:EVE domain-containing protein [Legionella brunensis]|uniref:UPF0310 protein Lbru_0391 n=1 Tax=Legionella brunensis TaxID=29422 RepID=A0A0W0SSQ9_9GAMM|nr:EVE domain-containing protein [Legionella brunensis]KTC86450.1 hypothetical protein Lbru_0391 [Legionella brunensis]
MSRNWLAVASAEHVRQGRQAGFMQVCHGKESPLRRIKYGDHVVYYSPTLNFGGKEKCQLFTAIGTVLSGEPYQVEMSSGFHPYRRNVAWASSIETPILPLLDCLEFTKNKKNWGYQFRYGLISISERDMTIISKAMQANFDDNDNAENHNLIFSMETI